MPFDKFLIYCSHFDLPQGNLSNFFCNRFFIFYWRECLDICYIAFAWWIVWRPYFTGSSLSYFLFTLLCLIISHCSKGKGGLLLYPSPCFCVSVTILSVTPLSQQFLITVAWNVNTYFLYICQECEIHFWTNSTTTSCLPRALFILLISCLKVEVSLVSHHSQMSC